MTITKQYDFAPKSKLHQPWLRYKHCGDLEAGKEFCELAREEASRTGVDILSVQKRVDLECRQENVKSYAQEVTPTERHAAGSELDLIAKDFCLREGIGYSAGLKKALLGNPIMATKYLGRPVRADGFAEAYGLAQQTRRYEVLALQELSNIVTGLPRLSDGRIDVGLAVRTINGDAAFRGLARQAAREVHDNRLVRRNPAVERVASGGTLDAEGLRAILWQFNW